MGFKWGSVPVDIIKWFSNLTWRFSLILYLIQRLVAGKLLLNLMDHIDIVRDLTFAPDGSLILVSASRDKTLRVWDLKDDGM